MSGSLVFGLWAALAAAEPPAVSEPLAPPRQKALEVGAGVALTMGAPSVLVLVTLELPVFAGQSFFVGFTVKADWRYFGAAYYSLSKVHALAGLRLGARLGVLEFFLGFGAGAAGQWTRTEAPFHGWWMSYQMGVAFQAGAGARVELNERVTIFLAPAEVTGALSLGNPVVADFSASAGLGIRL